MPKYSSHLIRWSSLALTGLIICTSSCLESKNASSQKSNTDSKAKEQDALDLVPVVTSLDEKMFPSTWLVPSINASAKPVSKLVKENGVAQIRKAMKKYPSDLLNRDLDRVYVVGELKFSGISAGGTNSRNRIYQAVRSLAEGYTNQYIEGAFHHEFSSILLRNHGSKTQEKNWAAANPEGFAYAGSGTTAVADGEESENYDPSLGKDGFFSQYAKASYEEDFNTIAAAIFLGREELWDSAKQFPPMKKKLRLAIAFYENLDSTLNESFFKSLLAGPTD